MKKRLLITRRLPDAAEARARETYDVVQHADDRQMSMDEVLETAKTVDALLITLNEKFRADAIAKVPDNIKIIFFIHNIIEQVQHIYHGVVIICYLTPVTAEIRVKLRPADIGILRL